MSYEIEKNIPLPVDGRRGRLTIALEKMEIGDSFKLPDDENVNSTRVELSRYGKKIGKKFSVREIDGGHRIWRIK